MFYGVLPGVDRPFREPGIEVFEPVPPEALSPPSVPRFDANPERIRVDSDAIGGVALDVTPGATVTNLVGPLDYSFRSYTIDLDPASPAVVTGVDHIGHRGASGGGGRIHDRLREPRAIL